MGASLPEPAAYPSTNGADDHQAQTVLPRPEPIGFGRARALTCRMAVRIEPSHPGPLPQGLKEKIHGGDHGRVADEGGAVARRTGQRFLQIDKDP